MITYENAMMELNFPGSIGSQKKRRITELLKKVHDDNATLEQQLAERNAALKKITDNTARLILAREQLQDDNASLRTQLAASQRRERAAVEAIKDAVSWLPDFKRGRSAVGRRFLTEFLKHCPQAGKGEAE